MIQVSNINKIYLNNNSLKNIKQNKQENEKSFTSTDINLNNSPISLTNKNLVSFKSRYYNRYKSLFTNFDKVYNSKTEILPKRYYSGFTDKSIYLSEASASAPLSQENFWKLFSPNEFRKMLNENPELSNILYNSSMGKCFLKNGIDFKLNHIRDILKKKAKNHWNIPIFDFTEAFEKKFNIDLLKEPKYYRFIGKNELVKLLRGEDVEKLPPYHINAFDITTNPELNWNQYRVTFKTNDDFTNIEETHSKNSRIFEHDCNDYRYYLKGPYSLNDIERIEMATPHGLLEFDLKHKYSNEELDVINTLMFCE